MGDTRKPDRRNRRRAGNNIIEFSFLMPWYVFLFVGTYDFGFFAYSLISVQTAATVGATYCATNSTTATDSTTACGYALNQLINMPNVSACAAGTTVTSSAPLAVSASSITGASSPDGNPATAVTVTYLTPQLIPIPVLLPGTLTITRVVKMRMRG
ncbi:MAG: TadE family protein [Bryobacteraceae bacterium]